MLVYFLVDKNYKLFSRKAANYVKVVLNVFRPVTFQVTSVLTITQYVSFSIHYCFGGFPSNFIQCILYTGDIPSATFLQQCYFSKQQYK